MSITSAPVDLRIPANPASSAGGHKVIAVIRQLASRPRCCWRSFVLRAIASSRSWLAAASRIAMRTCAPGPPGGQAARCVENSAGH